MIEWGQFIVFLTFGICIAVTDFRKKKIPNIFLLFLAIILIFTDLLHDPGLMPLKLLSGIGALGLFYIVFRWKGGLGFGDVKYAGVIGYYLGPERVIAGLLCACFLGLLYWFAGHLIFKWSNKNRIPFGPWLGCGTAAAVLIYRGIQ